MIEGIDLSGIDLARCLIPIGALLLGWVLGFFDSNNRTAKKIQEAEGKAELEVKEAKDKIAEADARLALFSSITPDDPGLLRLKDADGFLSLELDGERVDISTLTVDEKKRLIELLTVMRPWLEGGSVQQSGSRPAAPRQTPPAPVSAIMPALVPETKPDIKKAAPPPTSIVEQIDSILQLRMMNTPLAKQDIRLVESHEGGVEVFVGMNKYSTVDEVPDENVKSAIRAAIEEWEKKYTPGL